MRAHAYFQQPTARQPQSTVLRSQAMKALLLKLLASVAIISAQAQNTNSSPSKGIRLQRIIKIGSIGDKHCQPKPNKRRQVFHKPPRQRIHRHSGSSGQRQTNSFDRYWPPQLKRVETMQPSSKRRRYSRIKRHPLGRMASLDKRSVIGIASIVKTICVC